MAVPVTVRFEDALMEKIDAFAKSKEMNRSEAIKHLVDLGLKLNDIRENAVDDMTEERDKMQIEMWVALNKLIIAFCKVNRLQEIDKELLKSLSPILKERFCKRYEKMAEIYSCLVNPN